MAFFKRAPANKRPGLVPEQISAPSFRWTLAKFIALPLIPVLLLMWFGSPALRITYVWNGNDDYPVFSECIYLNLFSGWEQIYPAPGVNNCALARFFPFHITNLLKG